MLFYARKVSQQVFRSSESRFSNSSFRLISRSLFAHDHRWAQWRLERERRRLHEFPFQSEWKTKIEIYYEAHTIMEKLSKHSQRWLIGDRAWDWPAVGTSTSCAQTRLRHWALDSLWELWLCVFCRATLHDRTTNNCTRQIKFQQSLICILIKSHLNIEA